MTSLPFLAIPANPAARADRYRLILQAHLDRAETDIGQLKIPAQRGPTAQKSTRVSPQIFFQETGSTHFELPHGSLILLQGDVALLPAGMPRKERWSGADFLVLAGSFAMENLSFRFTRLERNGGRLIEAPADTFACAHSFAALRHAEELTEPQPGDAISMRLRQGLYQALLARLIQCLTPLPQLPCAGADLIDRCNEIIALSACRVDFSVAWLAGKLGRSPDHVSRGFRARTGRRIMETVHRRRIDEARRFLRESDMNIDEIGWACGFSRPSYFNYIFKRISGATPTAYRMEIKRRLQRSALGSPAGPPIAR
ncbi:MAG TPA: helix-turn-helix transcriptional regulator [Chthoniobacteraceae bacterium]|jgi:AraC-like DNA-binding protein|nr:helix-turn-helix transcriptional regulator [Chthoniobacteraceae bacterium]